MATLSKKGNAMISKKLRFILPGVTIAAVLATTAVVLWAQTPKAGLWDVTSTMTWQQSPFPGGMGPGGGAHTTQACVTQEQIDKYGTVPPQKRDGCEISNYVKKANGYSADMVCSGRMSAKGTVNATLIADGHGKTNIHMLGSIQMGPNTKPFEYTIVADSVFKSPDCGGVKPVGETSK